MSMVEKNFKAEINRRRRLESTYPGLMDVFVQLVGSIPPSHSKQEEFPMAAAIVEIKEGKLEIFTDGLNEVNKRGQPGAHAEAVAIEREAAKKRDKHLTGMYLVTTVEPCLGCVGDAINAGLKGVFFGLSQKDIKGKHVYSGEKNATYKTYRDFRGYNGKQLLNANGVGIVEGGLYRDMILQKLTRTYPRLADMGDIDELILNDPDVGVR